MFARQFKKFALFSLLFVLHIYPLISVAADVKVFAAASLKEAMDEQAKKFEASTGNKVIVSYAGSNVLAKQIEAGAPVDIFISADMDWMDYVEKRNLLLQGSRHELLRNTLVLIAPAKSTTPLKIQPGFNLSDALGAEKLAMANPDTVPAGKYGKQALEQLKVWADVEKKVARAENVRAALALVSRGETPFGIVYRTDALADKNVRIVDTFPSNTHPVIVYPIAQIKENASSGAKPLLDYLRAAPAGEVWTKYGFQPVK